MFPTRFPSNPTAYQILRRISNGDPVAIVYKAICLASDTIVAIKIINRAPTAEQLRRIKTLNHNFVIPAHPNILKPHCFFVVEEKLWVVMPYVAGGSLQCIMNCGHPHGLSPKCISTILVSVVDALKTFHSRDIAHKGVKPGNILLDRDGTVKLSDFGVSSWNYQYEWSDHQNDSVIPPYWVPPEVWEKGEWFGNVSDIWSLGVTALELLHGRPPFAEFSESICLRTDILKRFHYSEHYKKGKGPMILECPGTLLGFIARCINALHPMRPSSEKLLDHIFLTHDQPSNPRGYLVEEIIESLLRDEEEYWASIMNCRLIDEPNAFKGENASGRTFKGWIFNSKRMEMSPVFQADGVFIDRSSDKRVRVSEEGLDNCGSLVGSPES